MPSDSKNPPGRKPLQLPGRDVSRPHDRGGLRVLRRFDRRVEFLHLAPGLLDRGPIAAQDGVQRIVLRVERFDDLVRLGHVGLVLAQGLLVPFILLAVMDRLLPEVVGLVADDTEHVPLPVLHRGVLDEEHEHVLLRALGKPRGGPGRGPLALVVLHLERAK